MRDAIVCPFMTTFFRFAVLPLFLWGCCLSALVFAQEEYPEATWSELEGVVVSPFPPYQKLDVKDMDPGSLALDPASNEVFRVPFPEGKPQSLPIVPRSSDPIPKQPVREEDMERFFRRYVASGESNQADACLPFYDQQVESYFGKSNFSHDEILQDRAEFIHRWPQRSYWLEESPILVRQSGKHSTYRLRVGYEVRNGGKVRRGSVTDEVDLVHRPQGHRIIGIEEQ
ncbi:MAG: hypothetical protein AAGJ31_08000 [Verrucomicrobiota bacterium]